MKYVLMSAALLAVTFSTGAEAKGCIKGAVVGGIAGSVAGHGKVGAVAGCVIGRHQSNKADAAKGSQPTQPATR
jgi:outer membrane lipoprotein SlyB